MKINTYICDRCGKEVKWLYSMPKMMLEGLKISLYNDPDSDLCKDCANLVMSEYIMLKRNKLKICPRGRKKPSNDRRTLEMIMNNGGWVGIVFRGKIDGYEDHYDTENDTTTFDSNDLLVDSEKIFGMCKGRDDVKSYYTYLSVMK